VSTAAVPALAAAIDRAGALREPLYVAYAADRGVTAERVLVEARPVEGLIGPADERDARLIVVGASGEGPIAGAILGSVSYTLLHRSHVPVLVGPGGSP
jgi:nucleotide-binding universal stress UspA family protein